MVDMHAHTDTHSLTHSHTHKHTHTATQIIITLYLLILEHHSLIPGQSPANGSGEKITAFVSLSSTNTVCSRTRPNSFQPGANFLNCHSYNTARTQIKSLIWLAISTLHNLAQLMMYFASMKEPHPGEVNNNCMQPSMNDHRLLSVSFIAYLKTLSARNGTL